MLLQVINLKKKKSISPLISYVLLISFLIVIAGIVYVGLKTYVPRDAVECPDGVSITIKNIDCPSYLGWDLYHLYLGLENNGRFDIGGYLIYADNQTDIMDISPFFKEANPLNIGRHKVGNAIVFSGNTNNPFIPESNVTNYFFPVYNITSVEITPIRFQKEGDSRDFVICTDAKITYPVTCYIP